MKTILKLITLLIETIIMIIVVFKFDLNNESIIEYDSTPLNISKYCKRKQKQYYIKMNENSYHKFLRWLRFTGGGI